MSRLRARLSWKWLLAIAAIGAMAVYREVRKADVAVASGPPEPAWSSERPYAALDRQ